MSYLGAQFDFEVCVVGFHIELVNCFSVLFPVLFVIYAPSCHVCQYILFYNNI